jgi:imidazolonepropionase-like amidohydrolase
MRLRIDVELDYHFPAPADVLLAVEVAQLPDQILVEDLLTVDGAAGPLRPVAGEDGIGQRTWLTAGGPLRASYRATVDVTRAPVPLEGLPSCPLAALPAEAVAYLWPSRENIERAARLGVVVATQPSMQYTFGPVLAKRFGTVLMAKATPVRGWLDGGVKVGGGSDSPITPYRPLLGLWQARTRHIEGTDEVVGREQVVTGEQALAMYTRDAAYVSFIEHQRGTLRPGIPEDWTALSVDPVACEAEALREASVLATAVGGALVHGG